MPTDEFGNQIFWTVVSIGIIIFGCAFMELLTRCIEYPYKRKLEKERPIREIKDQIAVIDEQLRNEERDISLDANLRQERYSLTKKLNELYKKGNFDAPVNTNPAM